MIGVGVATIPDVYAQAVDDSAETGIEYITVIDVLANDTITPGTVITDVTQPTSPRGTTITQFGLNYGTVSHNGTHVTWTPDINTQASPFGIRINFTYTISSGTDSVADVRLRVLEEYTPDSEGDIIVYISRYDPITVQDNAVTDGLTSAVIDVLANDRVNPDRPDADEQTLSITNITDITFYTGDETISDPARVGTISHNGTHVTYMPGTLTQGLPDGSRLTSIYTVSDGTYSARAGVTVTFVYPPFDAIDDEATNNRQDPTVIDVLANDIPQTELMITDVTQPAGDPITQGTASHNGTHVTYTPGALTQNIPGQTRVTFGYTIGSGLLRDSAVVTVTLRDPAAFEAIDDTIRSLSVGQGNTHTLDVLANDITLDGAVIVSVSSLEHDHPSGIDRLPPQDLSEYLGSLEINGAGNRVIYTEGTGYRNGASPEYPFAFNYTISNGVQNDIATVHMIDAPPAPEPAGPIDAVDDTVVVQEDISKNILVLGNDIWAGSTLKVTTQPRHGLAQTTSGNYISYLPDSNYNGPDSFEYTLTSGDTTDTATVSITVNATNDRPVLTVPREEFTTESGSPISFTVTATDPDVPDETITFDVDSPEGIDTPASIDGDGLFTWNGVGDIANSPFEFNINATSEGDTVSRIVRINLVAPGSLPDPDPTPPPISVDHFEASDDNATTITNTPITIRVVSNDMCGSTSSFCVVGYDVITQVNTTISIIEGPSDGTATVDGGSITYTPDANYLGQDTIVYELASESAIDRPGIPSRTSDTATVSITVESPIIASDDNATTITNTTITIRVVSNDMCSSTSSFCVVGYDVITQVNTTISIIEGPSNGTATVDGGSITYTPDANYLGQDTIVYELASESAIDRPGIPSRISNTATVTIETFPQLANYTRDIPPNTGATIDPDILFELPGDIEPQGITISRDPGNGRASYLQIGMFDYIQYIPDSDYTGVDSFDYTVTHNGASSTATITIIVSDPIVARNDETSTAVDTPVTIDVTENDEGIIQTRLDISAEPSNGTAVVIGDQIRYTPDAGYLGTDTFEYTISRGSERSTAEVEVMVGLVRDTTETLEDQPVIIDVLANDLEPGAVVSDVSDPSHGSASHNTTHVTYTPDTDYIGTDSFEYTATADGSSGTATVTVTVKPYTVDDTVRTFKNQPVAIDVLANDNVARDQAQLANSGISDPSHGTVTLDGLLIVYTPDEGYNGTDTFTYTLQQISESSGTATVTVTIAPATRQLEFEIPELTQGRYIQIDEGQEYSFVANVTNDDGNLIHTFTLDEDAPEGATISEDGFFSWTPDANQAGQHDIAIYLNFASSQVSKILRLEVIPTDRLVLIPPVRSYELQVGESLSSTPVRGNILYLNSDQPPATLTYSLSGAPAGVTVDQDGTISWTPDNDDIGEYRFRLVADDGNNVEGEMSIGVRVHAAVISNLGATVNAGNFITMNLAEFIIGTITDVTGTTKGSATFSGTSINYTANAGESGADSIRYETSDSRTGGMVMSITSPSGSNLNPQFAPYLIGHHIALNQNFVLDLDATDPDGVINSTTQVPEDLITYEITSHNATGAQPTINQDSGTISWTPDTIEIVSVAVRASDRDMDNPGTSDITLFMTVINEPPTITGPEEHNFVELEPGALNFTAQDETRPSGDLTWSLQGEPAGMSITSTGPTSAQIRWTPTEAQGDDIPITVTVTVSDGQFEASQSVTVTAVEVNQNPVFETGTEQIAVVNVPYTLDVTATDGDLPEQTLSYNITSHNATGAQPTINQDSGTISWTPDTIEVVSITVRASDDLNGTTDITIVVTVLSELPANTAPVAGDFSVTVAPLERIDVNLTDAGHISDAEQAAETLTVRLDDTPVATQGVASIQRGVFTYFASGDATGVDTLSYTVTDAGGLTDSGTITVTIQPPQNNTAPVAADFSVTVAPLERVNVNLTDAGHISDAEQAAGTLTVRLDDTPVATQGVASIQRGVFAYFASSNATGVDTLSYTVTDAGGLTDSGTITVTIQPPQNNTAPVAADFSVSVVPSGRIDVNLTDAGHISDAEQPAGTLTVTLDMPISMQGVAVIQGDIFVYLATSNATGVDTLSYTVTDAGGLTDSGTITITIDTTTPPPQNNTAPVATDFEVTAIAGQPTQIDLTQDDRISDAEQAAETLRVLAFPPDKGTATVNGTTITYTADAAATGQDRFAYAVSDNGALSDSGTIIVTIQQPQNNTMPMNTDFEVTAIAGQPTQIDLTQNNRISDAEQAAGTLRVQVFQPDMGTVTVNGTTITYVPNPGASGQDMFTYRVFDSAGLSDVATITITIETTGSDSDDDDSWRKTPTFGRSFNTNEMIVSCGYSMDGVCRDVTDYHVDYERQTIQTGSTHDFALKAYGEQTISMFQIGFGVPSVGSPLNTAEALIEVTVSPNYDPDSSGYDIADVVYRNPNSVIDEDAQITVRDAACEPGSDLACVQLDIRGVTFREQMYHEPFVIFVMDSDLRSSTFYMNDGLLVQGESLNPAPTATKPTKSGNQADVVTIQLTRTDKLANIWTDQIGNKWTQNEYGTWLMVYTVPKEIFTACSDDSNRYCDAFKERLQAHNDILEDIRDGRYGKIYTTPAYDDLAEAITILDMDGDSRTRFLEQTGMMWIRTSSPE